MMNQAQNSNDLGNSNTNNASSSPAINLFTHPYLDVDTLTILKNKKLCFVPVVPDDESHLRSIAAIRFKHEDYVDKVKRDVEGFMNDHKNEFEVMKNMKIGNKDEQQRRARLKGLDGSHQKKKHTFSASPTRRRDLELR